MTTTADVTRMLLRHLRDVTRDFKTETKTVNVADPTEATFITGYVLFEYDPFLPLEDVDGYGLHPVMGTSYAANIVESWGVTTVTLHNLGGEGEHFNFALIDNTFTGEADTSSQVVARRMLDELLNGRFEKTRPVHNWLELEYAVENDYPRNR